MGTAELFIEAKKMCEKHLQKQNDSHVGMLRFCEESKEK